MGRMKTLVVFIALVATIHTKPNLVFTPYAFTPYPPSSTILRNILPPSYYILPSVSGQAVPSVPTLNAAIHGKSVVCKNNLNQAVPCAHTTKDESFTQTAYG